MPKLTIDDRELEVPAETNLIEAAKQVGIELPVFCYHRYLEPVGVCRICLVEIEGARKPEPACTTIAQDGMVVRVNSPEAIKARKAVFEFLLINHPLDCPVCDRGGWCDLQNLVYQFAEGETRFIEPKRVVTDADFGPFIYMNHNRCILCYRCTRYYDEIVGKQELQVFQRGDKSEIWTYNHQPLTDGMAGNLVEVCPLGALTDKPARFRVRYWEMRWQETVCGSCSVGCLLKAGVKQNQVMQILTGDHDAVNELFICDRGRFAYRFLTSAARLRQPQVRRNGGLEGTTWETAVATAADRLTEIRERQGGDSIGVLVTSNLTNEELYLVQRLAREVLDTPHVDTMSSYGRTTAPLREALGVDAGTVTMASLERAGAVLLVGCDLDVEQPVAAVRLRRAVRNGAALAVVNARNIELRVPPSHRLTVRSGCEPALLWALVAALVREGIVAPEDAAARVEGFEGLRESLAAYTPEAVGAATGVAWDAIRAATRALAGAPGCAVLFGEDIFLHPQGEDCVRALVTFAALTGNLRAERGGIAPMRHSTNAQGALDMGCDPNLLPGHRPAQRPGMHAAEMLAAAAEGRLRALLCIGADPLTRLTDSATASAGIENLEFLLVHELFPTATAEHAHVLLPAASFMEKEGTFTNFERRVQRLTSPIPPPAEVQPDWHTLLALARALGAPWGYDYPGAVFSAAAREAPTHHDVTFGRADKPGVIWPLNGTISPRVRVFTAPSPHTPERDGAYPFALTVGVRMTDGPSLTTDDPDRFGEVIGPPFVEMHPDDAARLGISDGDSVEVSTRQGTRRVQARVRTTSAPGVLFIPRNLREANVPALFGAGGVPCPAQVRRVSG